MPSTPDPEPFEGPDAGGPDRSEGAYPRQPEEAGFWAVPGVDPPKSATPARAPGSSGVEGYRPVAGQRVDAVVEQVRKIGDPGE
ncbi:MAG: hypothetical protein LBK95_13430, partial [Bifidobacteriaceae bacterium]|nr:hypothetical protein [Bifidobacteriaceae bacterium]